MDGVKNASLAKVAWETTNHPIDSQLNDQDASTH